MSSRRGILGQRDRELDAWCKQQRVRLDMLIDEKKCPTHDIALMRRGVGDEGKVTEHTLYVCPMRGCVERLRAFKVAEGDRTKIGPRKK